MPTNSRHIDCAKWEFKWEKQCPPQLVARFGVSPSEYIRQTEEAQRLESNSNAHSLGTFAFLGKLHLKYDAQTHDNFERFQGDQTVRIQGESNIRTFARWLTDNNREHRNDPYLALIPQSLGGHVKMQGAVPTTRAQEWPEKATPHQPYIKKGTQQELYDDIPPAAPKHRGNPNFIKDLMRKKRAGQAAAAAVDAAWAEKGIGRQAGLGEDDEWSLDPKNRKSPPKDDGNKGGRMR